MTEMREWEQWETRWRAARTSPAELEAMIERTMRARRSMSLLRHLSTVLAVVSLAVVGAALRHAGNAFEVALGLVVGVGIVTVWAVEAVNHRRAVATVDAPAAEYREARRALCVRQDRFAKLGWIVVILDLVFLLPWWIGGMSVHGPGFHPIQLLTMWTPLALMAGFVWWTIALRKRARAELERLDEDDAPP